MDQVARILNPCAELSVSKSESGPDSVQITVCNPAFSALLTRDSILARGDFRSLCSRSALRGEQCSIHMELSSGLVDVLAIPMQGDSEEAGSCLVILQPPHNISIDPVSIISTSTAEAAIKASLALMEDNNFEHGVQQVLRDIISISGGVISRVFLMDHSIRNVHTYSSVVSKNGENRDNNSLTYDFICQWERCTAGKRVLVVTSDSDFTELARTNPEWVADLKSFGVKSVVLIPLRRGKELYGFVDILDFDVQKAGVVRELGGLISIYLGTEISNHLLMDKLEEMSTTDALTGLKNRTAMLQRLPRIEGTACGIVNLDLNGLKRVNDTQGHDAGDRLLILAAEALKKIYYIGDIFRTGGDEFVVILPGVSEETFSRKLNRFLSAMEKNDDVSLAVGAYWTDGTVDMATAFRNADDAMYANKTAYYMQHPEMRRRS